MKFYLAATMACFLVLSTVGGVTQSNKSPTTAPRPAVDAEILLARLEAENNVSLNSSPNTNESSTHKTISGGKLSTPALAAPEYTLVSSELGRDYEAKRIVRGEARSRHSRHMGQTPDHEQFALLHNHGQLTGD